MTGRVLPVRLSRLLQILHDILIIPSSDLKIRVQVKRRGGGRETDDIARFGGTARQLDGVLHTVGVQDGQTAPGKAIALADGLLDAGAGSAHQHQRLDVGENLRGQRLIGDLFVVAARDQDDLLVKAISYGEHKWFSLKEMWDTGYDKKGGMILYHI